VSLPARENQYHRGAQYGSQPFQKLCRWAPFFAKARPTLGRYCNMSRHVSVAKRPSLGRALPIVEHNFVLRFNIWRKKSIFFKNIITMIFFLYKHCHQDLLSWITLLP
jgi:hypothetical protein